MAKLLNWMYNFQWWVFPLFPVCTLKFVKYNLLPRHPPIKWPCSNTIYSCKTAQYHCFKNWYKILYLSYQIEAKNTFLFFINFSCNLWSILYFYNICSDKTHLWVFFYFFIVLKKSFYQGKTVFKEFHLFLFLPYIFQHMRKHAAAATVGWN